MLNTTLPISADSVAQAAADTTQVVDPVQTIYEQIDTIRQMPVDEVISILVENIVEIGLKFLVALVIFYVGKWIIRHIRKVAMRIMEHHNVDISLRLFISNLIGITLIILLIVMIIGVLGLDTTSFVAIFASASLAIGMALSGTLQNFAGGVMILLFKPFKVGDCIEAQGQIGVVKEIQLFNTLINTFDNKAILIPNNGLSTGIINNYSREQVRRVDWVFNISYGDSYDKAKEVLSGLLEADARVLKDPAYFIALQSLSSSSVDIVVRAWVKSEDYWNVCFDMNEKVYKVFGENGLNIPYNKMDVYLYNQEK